MSVTRTTALTIFLLFFLASWSYSSTKDSLENQLKNLEGKDRIETLLELTFHLFIHNPSLATKYGNEVVSLAGNDLEFAKQKADAHSALGSIYLETGDFEGALEHFEKALTVYEAKNDTTGLSIVYSSIGHVYQEQGFYQGALKNYQKSIELAELNQDTLGMASGINDLGELQFETKNYTEAQKFYRQSHRLFQETGLADLVSIPLHNIGRTFIKLNVLDSADYYLRQSEQINKEYHSYEGLAYDYHELGNLASTQGKYSNAVKYYDSALQFVDSLKLVTLKCDILFSRSKNFETMGLYDSALASLKRYNNLRDSLYSYEKNRMLLVLKSKLDLDQKNKEIELLTADTRLQNLELKRRRTTVLALLGMLILLMVVLFILSNQYRQKRASNKLLTAQNDKIIEQNSRLNTFNRQLQESRKELKKLNSTKDKFFSIISHDLKSPLNSVSGMLNLLLSHPESFSEEEKKMMMHKLQRSFQDLSSLTNNLLQWGLTQMGKTPYRPQMMNLYETFEDAIDMVKNTADQKNIRIENLVNGYHMIFADRDMLEFIVRNILNNAIKFTPYGGTVKTTSEEAEELIIFRIEDSGVGMDQNTVEKVLSDEEHFTTRGTNNEKGTGLGLALCKEFVRKHEGTMEIVSVPKEGTTFIFSFPLVLANRKKGNKPKLHQEHP